MSMYPHFPNFVKTKLALDWSYQTGEPVFGPPAVVNGVVYIGSEDSYLYAFGASTAPAGNSGDSMRKMSSRMPQQLSTG